MTPKSTKTTLVTEARLKILNRSKNNIMGHPLFINGLLTVHSNLDVPDFLQEDGEVSTIAGSHQDILLGRQGGSPPSLSKVSSDSKKTFVLQINSNEVESKDNIVMKPNTRKPKKKLKEQTPSEELKCWSSPSDESLLSDDSSPGITKKRRKKTKKHYRSFGNPNLTLSIEYLRTPDSDMNCDEKYTSDDELCSECLWLVRTAKEAKVSSSSEDLDHIAKWNQSVGSQLSKDTKDNSLEHLLDVKGHTEKSVIDLLNEVHMKLVECSIILTTHKLNKKVKRKGTKEDLNKETPETLSDEKLLDEIQAEEDSKNGTSKLCLVLGKLVSKYLKTR